MCCMLVKKIVCDVKEGQQKDFDQAQRQWKSLSDIDGFLGQIGGWCGRKAIIIAFWKDRDTYHYFMSHEHDTLIYENHQKETYRDISIVLWESASEIHKEILDQAISISIEEDKSTKATVIPLNKKWSLNLFSNGEGNLSLYNPWRVLPSLT